MALTSPQIDLIRQCSKDEDAFEQLLALYTSLSDQAARADAVEGQLRDAEERFNLLVSVNHDAVIIWDKDLRRTAVYGHAASKGKLAALDADRNGTGGLTKPELAAMFEWESRRALAGEAVHYEWQDGADYYRTSLTPMRDEHGEITGVAGVIHNVTQLVETENALQEGWLFAEKISSTIPDLVYVYDLTEKRVVYANRELWHLLGYTSDQIQKGGTGLLTDLIHPDDLPREQERVLRFQTAQDGEMIEGEFRVRHAEGYWCWMHVRDTIFTRTLDGAPLQFLGVARDITSRKQAEAELQATSQRYNQLVESIPGMVYRFTVSPMGVVNFDYVSPSSWELNRVDAVDVLQNPSLLTSQIHPEDAPGYWQATMQAGLSLEPLYWEGRVVIEGKTYWRRLEARPQVMADGQVVWNGLQTDITEQKEAEETRRQQAQWEVALRKERELRELKDNMMRRIAHEFRTPLTIILTSYQMMHRYRDRMDEQMIEGHINKVHNAIRRLTEMLDAISTLMNHPLDPVFTPMDINAEIRQIAMDMEQTIGAKHSLRLELDEHVEKVTADRSRMDTIISNLLSNAFIYSPPGTEVTLSLYPDEAGNVILTVSDQGKGLSAYDQSNIFEPFFRGSNAGETSGIGLGLSLVQSMVKLHQGSVQFQSEPGVGTTVTVSLPLVQDRCTNNK